MDVKTYNVGHLAKVVKNDNDMTLELNSEYIIEAIKYGVITLIPTSDDDPGIYYVSTNVFEKCFESFAPQIKEDKEEKTYSLTPNDIDEIMDNCELEVYTVFEKCTVVACKLPNGFVLVESSACVDPTNYDEHISGKMMLVGYQSSTFHEEIKLTNKDILIIGDRYKVIEYAIESKVKLIVLALNNVLSKDLIEKAKENNVTIIRTKLTSFEIANMISLSNYISSIITCENPVTTFDDDFYDEFQMLARKTKHTNYPVINHRNECLGLISLNGINEFQRQKVILVDHNNFEQSVVGIEEAVILEIIDHHNLGRVGTKVPINFRSMPVGCTATIIYKMFLEKKVRIPKHIAGLLLSAIISDTLLFTSPSTTKEDKDAAEKLAKLAKVKIKEYGYQMLKASSSIDGLTINEQLYQDYKSYTVGKLHIGISQLITMDFDEIYKNKEEYIDKLDAMYEMSPGVNALFITDIIKKGSYVFYNTKSYELIRDAFNLKDIKQGIFIPGVISRKKQILPALMDMLEKQ